MSTLCSRLRMSITQHPEEKRFKPMSEENAETIPTEITEERIYTKRKYFTKNIKILAIIIAGMIYLIYGIDKLYKSYKQPSIRYSEKNVQSYDYPGTIACINASVDNFSVSKIVAQSDLICNSTDSCYTNVVNNTIYSKNRKTWQILHSLNYFDSVSESLSLCILIIPPNNQVLSGDSKNGGIYEVRFKFFSAGMLNINPDLNISNFLVDQYVYAIEYQTFHIDELYSTYDLWGFEIDQNISDDDAVYMAYETGQTTYYAPPLSRNDLELSLYTAKKYLGSESNSYSAASYGASIDATNMYNANDFQVGLYYYPNIFVDSIKKNYSYYQNYAEEYLAYDAVSLISGIGGIISTSQTVFDTFLAFFLGGLAVSFFCIKLNWNGYAPYPEFDEKFQKRLEKFLDNYERKSKMQL